MSDGRGNVRLMRIDDVGSDGMFSGMVRYQFRVAGSRQWSSLAGNAREEDQLQPLAVDADANSLYALRKKDGRYALYAIKLDGSGTETLVASNPRVDITDVVRIGNGLKVIGYTYTDDRPHIVYFDPEFRALADSLSRALPNLPIVQFVDATPDGQKLLIFAGSDTDPGRYYLFDRTKKTLNEAMLERPQLDGHALAQVTSVVIPAPDGAQIPAYLTLPPGAQSKNLPAVVLPHGGPSARDDGGFDWLAQFLAARGYAVLQPEYRGSSGFGDQWLNQNGFRNWRTAMSDIATSARWLQSQGIAKADRIAIVGWSYGGYAALMEAETDPKLYKAVVAIAPVTDLTLLKQEAGDFANFRVLKDFVGSGDEAIAGSPLRHPEEIQAPVLLAHGDMDTNVRFEQSQKMAEALEAAGRSVAFLSYKGLDHQLADANARADLLTHIAQMLDQAIGH
jgi:dipeptidyl aminopeptidase/acylaminoacyl peptidase